ncbi:unnamed protein product [Rhizoctonia solani]|uniref:Uncharacterized protein n=1 Tax=Rhizoctonia solani TaxID=456999 RepID=A0A8H3EDJ0_9AGAM|nr:unnamed protein product [Rhizoctonia solani]
MSIHFFRNGMKMAWKSSGDTLFSWPDNRLEYLYLHNMTLKVVDASPDARLTVTKVRVNGSSLTPHNAPGHIWAVPSNGAGLKYTGFVQQASSVQTESSSTYVSSTAGDTVSMRFNASALLVYGPCGPENGLMRVTLNGEQRIVDTSKPFACSDCLLFQARGLQTLHLHQLLIENVDGKTLGINRLEFFRVIFPGYDRRQDTTVRAMAVAFGIANRV